MSIVIRRLKGDLHFVALQFIQKNIRPYSMGKNSCPKPVTGKIVSEKSNIHYFCFKVFDVLLRQHWDYNAVSLGK